MRQPERSQRAAARRASESAGTVALPLTARTGGWSRASPDPFVLLLRFPKKARALVFTERLQFA